MNTELGLAHPTTLPATIGTAPATQTTAVMEQNDFRYYAARSDYIPDMRAPAAPLKLVIVTSLRDIADEKCGREVTIQGDRGPEQVYMKGAVQHLIEATHGDLGKYVQIAGIIVDDVPHRPDSAKRGDGIEAMGYSITPDGTGSWIAPDDLRAPCGRAVAELVHHLPSSWRKLPLKLADERNQQKYQYEMRLEALCQELGADAILSDHLIMRLEHLHERGAERASPFLGRVLNIHPGITQEGDPDQCRGLTPTADMIQRAQLHGTSVRHGASLHMVSSVIDQGAVIFDGKKTIVHPHDDTTTLRHRNYVNSKLTVLEEGLKYYASNQAHFDQHFGNGRR